MPTYQYRCPDCESQLEVVQKFTDDPLTECPSCGGSLRKVFSAVGVVFKGSGFYATDSRATKKKPGTSATSGKADSKPSGGESKASESKPSSGTSGAGKKPAASGSSSTGAPAA